MNASFYFVIPPGLESVAARELQFWLARISDFEISTPFQVEKGGIEMELEPAQAFALCRVLKIPTRILMRLARFRCRDFPTLYRRLQKIDWRSYVASGQIRWEVSCRGSRLKIEKRVQETCEDAYRAFSKGHEPKKESSNHEIRVFVRLADDEAWISLDIAGEDLFRRGYRAHVGEAPLRENLAAALLWALLPDPLPSNLTLTDPMMGAGTFLLEAFHLFRPNTFRAYSFEGFSQSKDIQDKLDMSNLPQPFSHLYGYDRDPKMVKAAQHNSEAAHIPRNQITLEERDVLSEKPVQNQKGLLICNPPYGERIEVEEADRIIYFQKICAAMLRTYPSLRSGILLPRTDRPPQAWLKSICSIDMVVPFRNGGLPVQFILSPFGR